MEDDVLVLHSTLPTEIGGNDDVEMDALVPKPPATSDPLDHADDSDSDNEDESNSALLGSHHRTRGRERHIEDATKTWSQILGIVLEVR